MNDLFGKPTNEAYKKQLEEAAKLCIYRDLVILLLGETGVGKSFLAKKLHKVSGRGGAFIQYNCAKAQQGELYQEIFGWEKGSFTGATSSHPGRIGLAENGTLFFDEVHTMGTEVIDQIKTVLDLREYWPLGAKKPLKTNASIIFATNENPELLVNKKIWNPDFYYRIMGVVVNLPPLREIKNQIPYIVFRILKDINKKNKFNMNITSSALEYLSVFEWPGNIRQLENYLKTTSCSCDAEGTNLISKEVLIESPPNFKLNDNQNNDEILEKEILQRLYDWKPGDENIFEGQIYPLAAKVYRKDFNPNFSHKQKEQMAKKIIGLGGGSCRSKLWKKEDEYDSSKNNNSK